MIAPMSDTKLKRTSTIKRKRSDISLEIKDAVKRLRELTDRVSESLEDLPQNVNPLVELLQAQTKMIEALSAQIPQTPDRSYKRQSADRYSKRDTLRPIYSIYENMSATHSSPALVESPVSAESETFSSQLAASPSVRIPEIRKPLLLINRRQSSQIAEIVHTPPTPPCSPPPPLVIRKSPSYPSLTALRPRPSLLSVNTTFSDTNTLSSPLSSLSIAPCSTCDSQSWHLRDRPDPRDSDLTCESHVLEATVSLIANMKEKKRTPIGPLDGGTFNLYSADYRRHYCVHDRPDRQSLLVYSQSSTWETDFPGLPAPKEDEVAMELIVYPDCLLIVKPFKVPRYASWKWHTLEALGDDARPTTIEILFLGNGFIKCRVRLSELLGEGRMDGSEQPDRFIEFAGIWSAREQLNSDDDFTATPADRSTETPTINHGDMSTPTLISASAATSTYTTPNSSAVNSSVNLPGLGIHIEDGLILVHKEIEDGGLLIVTPDIEGDDRSKTESIPMPALAELES